MAENLENALRYLKALEVRWTATVAIKAGPFEPGQPLSARFGVFLEFRDGLIVRQRNYDCFDPW